MINESKKYFCTRPKLLSLLMSNGFNPIETLPNFFNPKYKVWVFESTEELEQLVADYFETIKK